MENLRDNIVNKISFDIFGNMNLNLYTKIEIKTIHIKDNIDGNVWDNIVNIIDNNIWHYIDSSILLKNKVKQTILNNIIDGKYTMENYGQYL